MLTGKNNKGFSSPWCFYIKAIYDLYPGLANPKIQWNNLEASFPCWFVVDMNCTGAEFPCGEQSRWIIPYCRWSLMVSSCLSRKVTWCMTHQFHFNVFVQRVTQPLHFNRFVQIFSFFHYIPQSSNRKIEQYNRFFLYF